MGLITSGADSILAGLGSIKLYNKFDKFIGWVLTQQNKFKKDTFGCFFSIWEQVDATRTGVNEIVNKRVIDFLVLLIASDNNL